MTGKYTKYVKQLKELDDADKLKYLIDLKDSEKLPEDFV